MNIAAIKYNDIANGLGIRTTIFVSGCTNKCPGCFQPETWDPNYGTYYTETTKNSIIDSIKKDTCDGLTILGGEPFEPYNQYELIKLIEELRNVCPTKNIWMFTGFVYDDLCPGGKRYIENITDKILDNIDVLVDGPFIQEQKDLMLKFRGSRNQRIIDMKQTRLTHNITELEL